MPTKGRFQTGKPGLVKRKKQLLKSGVFPKKILAELRKKRFFNSETLKMLTMADPDFLAQAIKELASGSITVREFGLRVRGNAYLMHLSEREKSRLGSCNWPELVSEIRKIMSEKRIRMSALQSPIAARVRQQTHDQAYSSKVRAHFDALFNELKGYEARFFTFRQSLAKSERQKLWDSITKTQTRILKSLEQ